MTLAAECRRCHRQFEPSNRFAVRIVCAECLGPKMSLERQRPDCPGCGCERSQPDPHHFSLLCGSCRMDRKRESSRLNHHASRLTHRAVAENPAEPPTLDGASEDLRRSTLRLGQDARAAQVERLRTALASGEAYVSTDSSNQGGTAT